VSWNIIVCGDHPAIKNDKPHPDIYLEAARQLNLLPQNCLVFEDALSGIRSAKSAGCYVAAVPDPRFDNDEMIQFHSEVDVVLPDLWHFQGKQFGIDLDMLLLKPNV
jgi:beta-phosphoglucomutase-like phosphatase (HAD superfamily)